MSQLPTAAQAQAQGNLSTRQIARLMVLRARPQAELRRLWLRASGGDNVQYMEALTQHRAEGTDTAGQS